MAYDINMTIENLDFEKITLVLESDFDVNYPITATGIGFYPLYLGINST